jgi:hypothetical protein
MRWNLYRSKQVSETFECAAPDTIRFNLWIVLKRDQPQAHARSPASTRAGAHSLGAAASARGAAEAAAYRAHEEAQRAPGRKHRAGRRAVGTVLLRMFATTT